MAVVTHFDHYLLSVLVVKQNRWINMARGYKGAMCVLYRWHTYNFYIWH